MTEIILEKRYPHSREEDITDAFMRGYEVGREQEHRWWSAFCANCKDEPQTDEEQFCREHKCTFYRPHEGGCTKNTGDCPFEDEPQTERSE